MNQHTKIFGSLDDLRVSHAKFDVVFFHLSSEERVEMIGKILDHFEYANLSREDKGLVRAFIQRSTGYSRAQVARHMRVHQNTYPLHRTPPMLVLKNKWKQSMRYVFPIVSLAVVLLLSNSIGNQTTGSVLNVLNSERTVGEVTPGTSARVVEVRTLESKTSEPLLAIHQQKGETLVTWSLSDLFRRVDDRRIARLNAQKKENAEIKRVGRSRVSARPDILITKESFPFNGSTTQLHAAANDPWDIPSSGVEGQILMIRNGKVVWNDFPYLEQIRSEAPHGTELTRRAGGNRNGGSGDASSTTTTTVIQQTNSTAAPSGWTDGSGIVYLTEATDSVGIGTDTPSSKLEVVGSISGASLYISSSMSGAGLTDCDAGTSKLIYDATTGRFACATDQTVGTGLSQTTGDERYIQKQGGTMTGALTINITGGNKNTLGLNILNTISGAILHAEKTLSSSGSLTFEGAGSGSSLYIATSLQGVGLTDCDAATQTLAWDATTGRFSCGTDLDTNTTYTAAQGLALNGTAFSLNSTITGALVRFSTISGSTLYAKTALNASGSLSVDGTTYLNASAPLKITDAGFYGCTALETDADGDIVCGSDGGGSSYTAGQNLALNGTAFSLNSTITGALVRFSTISGSTLYAKSSLSTSGSLVFEGAASGSSLYIATSLQGVGLTDCDAANRFLTWDATTGRFSCGIDLDTDNDTTYTAGQGLSLSAGNAFSLNSTITGALVRFSTISGSTLYAKSSLSTSGSLVFEGAASGSSLYIATSLQGVGLTDCDAANRFLTWDATTGRFSCGIDLDTDNDTTYTAGQGLSLSAGNAFSLNSTITGSLVSFTTISGSTLKAQTSLASSGSLTFEGAASGSSLYIATSLQGVGLTDCDAASQTLNWDATTGRFSCGTDLDTNTTYTAAQNLTLNGTAFSLNSTITGSLVSFSTISGATIKAQNSLSSSGSLTWEGAASGASLYIGGSLNGAGLTDCDLSTQTLAWDATTGRFSCGTDSDTTYTAGRGLGLSVGNVFTLNSTITGSLVSFSTVSGSTIKAQNSLSTSGSLVFEGAASGSSLYIASSLQGVGLTDCDAATQTLNWDSTTGRFSCGTDADTTYTAAQNLTLNGTAFSLNSTITGALVRFSTISGSTLYAKTALNASGSLSVDGTAYFNASTPLKITDAGFYGCTALETDADGDIVCGSDGGGSSYTAGQSLSLNGTAFSLNSTITGSLVSFTTISGSTIKANTSLSSSGSLTWEGAGSGSSLYIATSLQGVGLTDCDAASQTLNWDATTGRFSCGTDLDTNTTYTAAQNLTLNGTAFSLNSTITGALVRFSTISGSTLYAKTALNASGSLSVDGTAYFNASTPLKITDAGFYGCTALETDADGDIVCGSDGGGSSYTAGQSLSLNGTAFSLNSTITGSLVSFTTISGSTIKANTSLSSSGSLTWEGAGSGSSLYIATSLQGVGLTDCDAASQTLNWDATTGRFSCGTDADTTYTAAQNLTLNGTAFSLNSTITGALVRFSTISGSTLYAKTALNASGSLSVDGTAYFNASTPLKITDAGFYGCTALETDADGDIVCGSDGGGSSYTAGQSLSLNGTAFSLNSTITGSLVSFTTISGSTIKANTSLSSSGSLTWEGAGSGSSLYIATSLQGVGLTDCDAASQTLNWDATTGRFSCGTDLDTNTTYTAAQNLTLNGTAFSLNSTITGALVRFSTISGSTLYAKTALNASGSLSVDGTAYFNASTPLKITDAGFYGCTALETDADGDIVCGSDGGGSSYTAGQSLSLNGTAFSLNSTITGSLVSFTTISGSTIKANTSLSTSGSLVFEGAASGSSLYIASSLQGVGLTDCDAATQTLNWDSTTGRFSCGTDADTTYTAAQNLTLNGTAFSLNSTITGALVRFSTISGSTLYAKTALNASGSLSVDGTAYFNASTPLKITDAGFYGCTALETDADGDIVCGSDGGGSSYTAGQSLSLNGTAFSLNSTITGSLVSFTTISGSTIKANTSLSSSGSLTWEGAGSGSSLYIATSLQGVGLTDCDAASQTLNWDATTGRFSCGTDLDTNTTYTAAQNLTLNGTAFSLNSTITGALVRFSTISGSTLYAKTALNASGSLSVDGTAYFNASTPLKITDAGFYGCTALETDADGDIVCGSDGGGSSYTAGQSLSLNGTAFSLNSTITGSLVSFTTISGSTIKANTSLSSSGSLTWEGAGSGSSLYIATSLQGVGLTDCDAANRFLTWDATTGRFSCGIDLDTDNDTTYTAGQGLSLSAGNAFSLNSTITGSLVSFTTISGSTIKAQNSLNSSGTLVFEGAASGSSLYIATSLQGVGLTDCDAATQTLNWDATTGRFSCGTDLDTNTTYTAAQNLSLNGTAFSLNSTITGSLVSFTTISGSTIKAQNSLNSSGTLVFEGAASGSSLYIATSLQGVGLTDCDIAGTSKLLWDSTTGRFSCGTDQTGGGSSTPEVGTSSFSGAVVVIGDSRYVNLAGDTMTGALIIQNGNTHSFTSTPLLNVRGTMSGRGLFVSGTGAATIPLFYTDPSKKAIGMFTNTPTSNGLTVDANINLNGNTVGYNQNGLMHGLQCANGGLCKILRNGTTTAEFGSQMLEMIGTLSGRLVTQNGAGLNYFVGSVGIGTTTPNAKLTVVGSGSFTETLSGSRIFGMKSLATSGSLTWEGSASGASLWVSTFEGAGLSDCDLSTNKIIWDSTLKRFACSTDLNTGSSYTAGRGLGLSVGNVFTLNSTITGSLVSFTTISGATIKAQNSLSTSGSLVFEGAASGSSLYIATSLQGVGLTDCDAATQTLNWDSTTGRFSCGTDLDTNTTYTAAQNLSLNGTAFSLNSTITGSLVRFLTVSGSTLFAKDTLSSSGQILVKQTLTSRGSGALTVVNTTRYGTGAYFASSGAILALDSISGRTVDARSPHILFGYKGTFDTDLFRSAASRLQTSGSLYVLNTISGSVIKAQVSISSSGTIVAKSDITTQATLLSRFGLQMLSGALLNEISGFNSAINIPTSNLATQGVTRLTGNGNLQNIGSIQAGNFHARLGGTFSAKTDYTVGTNPNAVAISDINGDGRSDMIVANQGVDTISIFLNTGNNTFAAKVDYAAGDGPSGISVGDVNGDGKQDLSIVNFNDTTVSIFINKGNGTFKTKVDYATSTNPFGVTMNDFNGDGKLDIAVTHFGASIMSVLMNTGDGTFATKVDYATPSNGLGIASQDLNGDSKADIAVTNTTAGSVSVFLNTGNGIFVNNADYALDTNNIPAVSIGDFNGDNKPDLAVAVENGDEVSIFMNNGDGTFAAKVDYTTGDGPRSLAIADMNGDGTLDMAIANRNATTFSALMNNGDGTFAAKVDYTAGSGPRAIAIGDVNADGKGEVVVANYDSTSVSLFTNLSRSILFASAGTGGVVGIGTSTPGSALSVSGRVLIGLNISNRSAKTALEVLGTVSGSKLFASSELSSSGILLVKSLAKVGSGAATLVAAEFQTGAYIYSSGATALALDSYLKNAAVSPHILFGYRGNFDTDLYRSAASRLQTSGSLYVLNTISGSTINAQRSLTSSGSLTWEGAGSGSSLYIATSLQGVGLTDCDIAGTSKLLWDATTGRFSCGTDQTGGGGTYTAGRGLGLNGTAFSLNSTITGSLVRFLTVSGSTLFAKDTLSSSGQIIVKQSLISRGSGALTVVNTTRYGTGAYFASSGAILALDSISGRTVDARSPHILFGYRGTFDTDLYRSAASRLQTSGSLYVLNTISGSVIKAQRSLSSSGSLIWEGAGSGSSLYIASSLQGVGLTDCDIAGTSKLLWDATTGRFSCGTDQTGGGSLSDSDARYVNTAGDTMTGVLVIGGTGSLVPDRVYGSGSISLTNATIASIAGPTHSSMTLGTNGMPVLAIYNGQATQLEIQFCLTSNCSRSTRLVADNATSDAGQNPSIAVGMDGFPVVAYRRNNDLYVLKCKNASCSSSGITLVNVADSPGKYNSLAIGADGYPVIAHFEEFLANLLFTKCSDVGCTSSVTTQIDTTGIVGEWPSVAIGTDGMPIISYYDRTNGNLKTLKCSRSDCASGNTISTVDSTNDTGLYTAIAIGTDGMPVISYQEATNGDLKFARCIDASCATSITPTLVTSAGTVGLITNLVIAPDGLPVITHYNSSSVEYTLVKCGNASCTSSTSATISTIATSSDGMGLAIGANGFPIYTYSKSAIGVAFVRCVDSTCSQTNSSATEAGKLIGAPMGNGRSYTPAFQNISVLSIGSPTALRNLSLMTNGITRMTITPNGKIGIGTTLPKASLEIIGTASGSKLFASSELSSSGILLIKSLAKVGSGAATLVAAEFQTGAYIYASGSNALALDSYSQSGAKAQNILFGYRGNFDLGLYRFGNSNSGGLALRTKAARSTTSVFQVITQYNEVDNTVFKVTGSGGVYADGRYNSNGADYAEWFMSKDDLQKGEVVCIDVTRNNAVARCMTDADSNVMGIVSTNPGFVGNVITGADGIIPPGYRLIGLIGQVPTKVIVENNEPIRPGDSLTPASTPGYARRARAGESTVGVALEGLESGEGVVNVLISRRNSSMTVDAVGQKVLDTIAAMEIDDEVQLLISNALGDLNVDQQISDEVTKQIDAIAAQAADMETMRADIESLKVLIATMTTSTGGVQTFESNVSTGALIYASAMEIDDTLVTGGDARIGGDLSIDGTLNASSLFVPNGLTIDGGVVMNGLLDAETLHVSSGAVVDGMLTINGTLNLASGAMLHLGSGALTMDQLTVENALFVMGDITINGLATFLGDLHIHGELIVNANQAGFAMIPASGTSVTIRFGTGFSAIPVVTASPDVPVLYAVTKSSATGFTIRLAEPALENVRFAWHALATENPSITQANLLASDAIIFPLDSNNVPVSSNMAWNACIRNITMLDDSGQPLSCSRYHEAFTWTHPDLGISFTWNTSMTPALLQLPEGYDAQVTEDAQTIVDAVNGDEDAEEIEVEEVIEPEDIPAEEEPVVVPDEEIIIEEQGIPEETPVEEEPVIVPAQEPVPEPETTPIEESAPDAGQQITE